MLGIRKECLNLNLSLRSEYEIINVAKTKSKNDTIYFKGVLIQETDYFYVFRCNHGYCECFLKVDFAIEKYSIKKFSTKAS